MQHNVNSGQINNERASSHPFIHHVPFPIIIIHTFITDNKFMLKVYGLRWKWVRAHESARSRDYTPTNYIDGEWRSFVNGAQMKRKLKNECKSKQNKFCTLWCNCLHSISFFWHILLATCDTLSPAQYIHRAQTILIIISLVFIILLSVGPLRAEHLSIYELVSRLL